MIDDINHYERKVEAGVSSLLSAVEANEGESVTLIFQAGTEGAFYPTRPENEIAESLISGFKPTGSGVHIVAMAEAVFSRVAEVDGYQLDQRVETEVKKRWSIGKSKASALFTISKVAPA